MSITLLRDILIREARACDRVKELERHVHQAGATSQQDRVALNHAKNELALLQGQLIESEAIQEQLRKEICEARTQLDLERRQAENIVASLRSGGQNVKAE